MTMNTAEFTKRAIIVIALALVPILVWFLFDVILIILGAVLVAMLLQLGAEPLRRWLRLPQSIALILSGVMIVGVVAGTVYLFGTRVGSQLQEVFNLVSAAQSDIRHTLQGSELGKLLLSHMQASKLSIAEVLKGVLTVSATFLGSLIVLVVAGVYLAAQPSLYRDGMKRMFTPRVRAHASEVIDEIGTALRRWLLGQLIQMVLIGACSGLAVWLIGLPTPWALGLIAGIAEFIPYLGPVIAAIPAVFVAATVNLHAIFWTILAYILIHQAEGHLFIPLIQRRMVFIPPAVMLLAIVGIDFLFGPVAMFLAAPMTVVLFVVVNKLSENAGARAPASVSHKSILR
jgi:predicted PurR-regulated permease PerM